jgi:hypothetical protein
MPIKVSDVAEINTTRWRSYFSFLLSVKSANRSLFKDFYNKKEKKKSKSSDGIYFIIVTKGLTYKKRPFARS